MGGGGSDRDPVTSADLGSEHVCPGRVQASLGQALHFTNQMIVV